jgi:hypothetical protein
MPHLLKVLQHSRCKEGIFGSGLTEGPLNTIFYTIAMWPLIPSAGLAGKTPHRMPIPEAARDLSTGKRPHSVTERRFTIIQGVQDVNLPHHGRPGR